MDELRRLFDYNRWAHLRLLDAVDELTPEELGRDMKSSFPHVAATLVHLLGAEWIWLQRWKGASPTGFPDGSQLSSVEALRARWEALWEEQLAFLATLEDGAATRSVEYRNLKGEPDTQPLGELMRHVVNHATYHRGQLVTMLRQLAKTPPSTDYVRYLRETR